MSEIFFFFGKSKKNIKRVSKRVIYEFFEYVKKNVVNIKFEKVK